jgi:squalene-associated FAD-dependent desaturase
VIGGGLAGMAAAAALGGAGYRVRLFEARGFLGGRAASYPMPGVEGRQEIDNCQHVLLRCCANLLDFYRRLGVEGAIRFHREFYFVEPGGRVSVMKAGRLPAPLHFSGSFARMRCFSLADKLGIARALLALRREARIRSDLDRITMLEWLHEKHQTPKAIERFWGQVLVSAVNEDLDRMAALHAFQVFQLGFLSNAGAYRMGVPAVPLASLYRPEAWAILPEVELRLREPVDRIDCQGTLVRRVTTPRGDYEADYFLSALPPERLENLTSDPVTDTGWYEVSPITGIHFWFDRPITELPHATLLDRTIQWLFNKQEGRYVQLVVSASRRLVPMSRQQIIDLALEELREFFPAARPASLLKAQVIKEVRATFSARPGLEQLRPAAPTRIRNLFLAGDWTRSGWPATMEGAVRSGYLAAEAICTAAGQPQRFLIDYRSS